MLQIGYRDDYLAHCHTAQAGKRKDEGSRLKSGIWGRHNFEYTPTGSYNRPTGFGYCFKSVSELQSLCGRMCSLLGAKDHLLLTLLFS